MNEPEYDRKCYQLAKDFLQQLNAVGVTPQLIDKYLNKTDYPKPTSLPEIYGCILHSAQNANMKATVIGKAVGGIDKLKPVLCNFEPTDILKKFPGGSEQVLDEIERQLKPAGKIRRTRLSLWPKFCQTILSAAAFLTQFSDAKQFHAWVAFIAQDARTRAALPMLLAEEISGFGFALSCDFLKEMGYVDFGKPDVHIKDIFLALRLCTSRSDYHVHKAIIRVAEHAKVTPYNADKVFWLIGSGFFYSDRHIGHDGKIGRTKDAFISWAKPQLGL